jgi:O-antigen ligase
MADFATMRRVAFILLIIGPITTLAVSPFTNFDPINLMKLLIVISLSFSILFLISSNVKIFVARLPQGLWISAVFFVAWMVISMTFSQSSTSQQLWGVFGRNNGFFSYFSLLVLLLAAALIQESSFYRKLVEAFVLTAFPMTIYALIQVLGLDPISWSEMAPFATLGNINFSSAFFGMASICATVLALAPGQKTFIRVSLLLLVIIDLWIVSYTGSIQGIMIYIAGVGVYGFFVIRNLKNSRVLQVAYIAAGSFGFALTVFALFNIGPAARFVFSNTILFRFDYWYAGWMMTLKNPIFGVGMDSYGDWYRELRGQVATLRTGPDRITNTAHNIYLDISASGGFPLLLAYGLLLFLALRASIRFMRRSEQFDGYFVALFSAWIAYLIQAAVSINQIGVGIWGWLFTGALIGYEIATRADAPDVQLRNKTVNKKVKSSVPSQIPASAALIGIAGFVTGFIVAFIPLKADADFKKALQTGDLIAQLEAASSLGGTAFHMELVLDASIKANNEELARQVTDQIIDWYPRDFMAWQVKQVLVSSSPQEREDAYQRLKAMDPYNPKIQRIP